MRAAEAAVGREGEPLRVFADIVVFLDGDDVGGAIASRASTALGRLLVSDTRIFAGSARGLADESPPLGDAGYAGVRLRPGVVTDDLPRIADDLVPELRRREPARDRARTRRRCAAPGPSHHRPQPLRRPNRFASALAG